ncbi:hypothetical protein L6452_41960 [Arctium lappa]|uniref:Uncharacterized protein n=1 Tax=Arctium lappa TaxID=4217 RepID=A0ACB8XGX7_ARCLA|nr:hypothetical protein L6452_41960 [Arctium lappa]
MGMWRTCWMNFVYIISSASYDMIYDAKSTSFLHQQPNMDCSFGAKPEDEDSCIDTTRTKRMVESKREEDGKSVVSIWSCCCSKASQLMAGNLK